MKKIGLLIFGFVVAVLLFSLNKKSETKDDNKVVNVRIAILDENCYQSLGGCGYSGMCCLRFDAGCSKYQCPQCSAELYPSGPFNQHLVYGYGDPNEDCLSGPVYASADEYVRATKGDKRVRPIYGGIGTSN
jgi:hypothetical protein